MLMSRQKKSQVLYVILHITNTELTGTVQTSNKGANIYSLPIL
jgi:hypothetical protein